MTVDLPISLIDPSRTDSVNISVLYLVGKVVESILDFFVNTSKQMLYFLSRECQTVVNS